MNRLALLLLGIVFLNACEKKGNDINPLDRALASQDPKIKRVMDSLDRYEVQIRYTQIVRRNDSIIFKDYDFNVDDNQYFYPASTVKFPIAVVALERLNEADTLTINTKYYVEGDTIESTFAKDITQIFAISDNLANNRLVELLGQNAINETLRKKGVAPVRISHRLGYHSEDLNTKPLVVYLNDSTTGITSPTLNSTPKRLDLSGIRKGKGYYQNDSLQESPFDFSLKNYFPISSQHQLLKRVIFPETFPKGQRFNISEVQRQYLLTAMHTVPQKVGYDPATFYDGYCKFFMYGDTKEDIPNHIEIYNKVGFAYGTLTDCAYIKDTTNNIDFMLTATILVNNDGIFNDDAYEYDEIGIPFLAQLGREIYKEELKRR